MLYTLYNFIPVLVMKELSGLAAVVAMLAELVDIHGNSTLPPLLPGDVNAYTKQCNKKYHNDYSFRLAKLLGHFFEENGTIFECYIETLS